MKFDKEASITAVKNTLTCDLCIAGGSSNVSKESPMSASTSNALIEERAGNAEHRANDCCVH